MNAVPIANGVVVSLGGQKWTGQSGTPNGVSVDGDTSTLVVHTRAGEHAPFDPDRKIRAELIGSHNFVKGEEARLSGLVNVSSASVFSSLEWNAILQIHSADTRRADGTAVEAPPLFEADVLTDSHGGTILQIRAGTGTGVPSKNNITPYGVLADVPFSLDIYHSFEYRIIDGHGGPGRISFWLDGVVVCDLRGINTGYEYVDLLANDYLVRGLPQSTTAYQKIGNYGGVGSGPTAPADAQMFISLKNISSSLAETSPVRLVTTISDNQLSGGETANVTFAFSEAVTDFDLSDVTTENGQLSNLTAVNASTYTALFTPDPNVSAQGSISVATARYTGLAGNTGTSNRVSFGIDTVGTDTVPPVFQSAMVTGDNLVLTYNKPLDAGNPPPTSAFTVTAGSAAVEISGLSVDGPNRTITLTLNSAVASDQPVTIAYTDPSADDDALALQDFAGNDAVSFPARAVGNATPDTSAPVYQSGTVSGASVVMTFGETLDATHPPSPTAFAVTVDGSSVGVGNVSVNGPARTVALTLASAVTTNQIVTVAYADPTAGDDVRAVQDLAGNDAAGLSATGVTNITPGTVAGREINDTDLSHSIAGGAGNDTLRGNGGDDTINGGAGNDYISGGTGNDRLIGGPGSNTIYGGPGADRFVFQSVADFGPASAPDVIQFITGDGDLIDLSAIDANTLASDKQGFTFIGTAAFSGHGGELRYQRGSLSGTLLLTADLDGDRQPDFQLVVAASTLTAGNFVLGVDTVPADTTPPTVAITTDDPQLTSGESANLTFRFSEPVTGFTSAAITAGSGQLSGLTRIDPSTYTAVFTPTPDISARGSVTLAPGSYTDTAGNAGAAATLSFDIDTILADTTPPTVAIGTDDPQLTAGESANLTFRFSEPVTGFTTSAITAASGQLSGLTRIDPSTYTAVFTPTPDISARGSVTLAPGSYTDTAGNAGAAATLSFDVDTVPVDTTPPTVAITTDDPQLTAGESANLTFRFSEPVTGFTSAAITAASGQLSGLTRIDPSTYTAVFTPTPDISARGSVTLAPGSYTDTAGNTGAAATLSFDIDTIPADTTPPTVAITTDDPQLTSGESANLTFQFSEPVTDFALTDIAGGGGQLSALTQINPSTYTALFTPTPNLSARGSVTVAAGSYTDTAGNAGAAAALSFDVDTMPADTVAPIYQSATVNGASLTLTYGEALDGTNKPAAGAFVVRAGTNAVAVNGVGVDSANRTVALTLASAVTAGQAVTVTYTDPSAANDALAIQDLAGNDAATFAAKAVGNTTPPPADTVAPTYQSATVNGASLTLTYGEALDGVNRPIAGAFVVRAGTNAVAVNGVSVDGANRTVTLALTSAVTAGQAVTVDYTDPSAANDALAIQDLAGNDAATFAAKAVGNTTPPPAYTVAPTYQSATVNGTSLTLTYSEALDGVNKPAAGAFVVRAGTNAVAVNGVSIDSANRTVALTLASAVTAGQAVTVAYTDPTAANDALAIQDLAGNDAVAFAAKAVGNTTPANAPGLTVNGSEAANTITGGAGNDTLRGNGGNDTINGAAGNDYISGGAGNDVIVGGPGTDMIYGGAGADRIVFQSVADFGTGSALDVVEFVTGDGDRLDLSAIDSNTGSAGVQGFAFVGTSAFSGQAGQLRYQRGTQGGTSQVSADLNGDRQSDFQFTVGTGTLTAGDFVLRT